MNSEFETDSSLSYNSMSNVIKLKLAIRVKPAAQGMVHLKVIILLYRGGQYRRMCLYRRKCPNMPKYFTCYKHVTIKKILAT